MALLNAVMLVTRAGMSVRALEAFPAIRSTNFPVPNGIHTERSYTVVESAKESKFSK